LGIEADGWGIMGQGTIIRVSRTKGKWWFAFQLFALELDGTIVGKLAGGESKAIEVQPGEHVLRVKFRRVAWSDKFTLSVPEGEQRLVECQTDWAGYPSIRFIPAVTK
jgi:hypothetical protein